ncbi:hypothetical protein [Aquimarina sp. 2201CG5-10]|uniref:hypothetical protein n=1 Tax=Aquimarina callyspongiae TaxID=3098150 RepID=UPI002AB50424|nr:hypothetical protein [Aquimarina sp. 2201CG5-10]MDY8135327.1 hypothetical protein [Aquimarina sp. 2201CG5-10]
MNEVFLKQSKPLKVKILGILIIVLIVYLFFFYDSPLSQIVTLSIISFLLLSYSISYEIRKDFSNYKHISFLGFSVFKQKLKIDFPDYISVFSASFKQDNEWGAISAIGKEGKHDAFVVRFFSGNKNFTIYKTNKYSRALSKSNKIGDLLNIEIHDATKE